MRQLINVYDEQLPIDNFTENAYHSYAMYVIMDRALPFIGDGLKPVQRRIIYAMSELKLNANAKYKKSARTVGDVLGKYHPHGDSACYEAMVLMSQIFSYRYPLIDGQGNWGTQDDPKSFAAMRYTESRLSKYSEIMLEELSQDTVDYVSNFDGTLNEPKVLPARLPNILLNGSSGIAVGMSTDIPPHNIYEVANAIISLLKNPKITLEQLLEHIHGPDFPTEAEIITSQEDLKKIYYTGIGSIRMRAAWMIENRKIVIISLPYHISCNKILEQISNLMKEKKLPMVESVQDESDYEHLTRLIIVPRSNSIDLKQIMYHLFMMTDLENSYRINMNIIGLNGRPSVKNLYEILTEWISFRQTTIRRRLHFQLKKILHRLHILMGMLVIYLNLNKLINIINIADNPKQELMKDFLLSEIQSDAILELKLRFFSKIEEVKICEEKIKLEKEKDRIQDILISDFEINNLIKKEIKEDAIIYGNERRSPIVQNTELEVFYQYETLLKEPITVILSKMGWIRKVQGHDIDPIKLHYKSGDNFFLAIQGHNNQPIVFLDSTGRSYSLIPYHLISTRSLGEPITKKLTIPLGSKIEYMLTGLHKQKFLMASSSGYGFICNFIDMLTNNKTGKNFFILTPNSRLIPPILINDLSNQLLAITKFGRILILSISDVPQFTKGKGKKIIEISYLDIVINKDCLLNLYIFSCKSSIILHVGKKKIILGPKNQEKFKDKCGHKGFLLLNNRKCINRIEIKDEIY